MTGLYTDNEFGQEITQSELRHELEKQVRGNESGFWYPVLMGIVNISLEDLEMASPRKLIKLQIVAKWKEEIENEKYRRMFSKDGD